MKHLLIALSFCMMYVAVQAQPDIKKLTRASGTGDTFNTLALHKFRETFRTGEAKSISYQVITSKAASGGGYVKGRVYVRAADHSFTAPTRYVTISDTTNLTNGDNEIIPRFNGNTFLPGIPHVNMEVVVELIDSTQKSKIEVFRLRR